MYLIIHSPSEATTLPQYSVHQTLYEGGVPMGLTVLEIEVGNPGAFTLEPMGLSLVPLRRELKPLLMILA